MLKRILILIISIFIFSDAGEFLDYNRAFKLETFSANRMDDLHGFSFGLNYEQRIGKSIIEFNLTPKLLFHFLNYSDFITDVNIDDTTYYDVESYSETNSIFSLETAILFSHRPAIKLKNGPGSFTYNLWRYGICFEWDIIERRSHDIDGVIFDETLKAGRLDKRFGLIYKPSIGIQLTKHLNLGMEIVYNVTGDISQYFLPEFSYGGGISLTISDPVSGF